MPLLPSPTPALDMRDVLWAANRGGPAHTAHPMLGFVPWESIGLAVTVTVIVVAAVGTFAAIAWWRELDLLRKYPRRPGG
jgi:hypothetical protein